MPVCNISDFQASMYCRSWKPDCRKSITGFQISVIEYFGVELNPAGYGGFILIEIGNDQKYFIVTDMCRNLDQRIRRLKGRRFLSPVRDKVMIIRSERVLCFPVRRQVMHLLKR